MRYRFNPTTCRYEPLPFRFTSVIKPVLILLLVSSALFFTLLLLHSAYITTDKALVLKRENQLLAQYQNTITSAIRETSNELHTLQKKDQEIQRQLLAASFNSPAADAGSKLAPTDTSDTNLLLASAWHRANLLMMRARNTNRYFASTFQLDNAGKTLLGGLPTAFPVEIKSMEQIASGFGFHINPFHKGAYQHNGIDFIASRNAPVMATAAGKVTQVRKNNLPAGEGNVIEIDHGNGFKTRYAYLGELSVKSGQRVSKGQVIAYVGISGGSAAPHLHYEILNYNVPVDPARYIMEDLNSTDYAFWLAMNKRKRYSLD
jgi:murein DD-endopeptidase MepM/ murein hydrolase activator NlpD